MSRGDDRWVPLARLPGFRGVLDPADVKGHKNRHIHAVHQLALAIYVDVPSAATVLDFGCGVGRMSEWLARHAGNVIGLDVTREMVAEAGARKHPANVRYIVAGSNAPIPLGAGTIDLVLTIYVLQHILDTKALRAVVDEFHRVLKPGGRIAIIEQVLRRSGLVDDGSKRQREESEYVSIFEAAGLRKKRAVTIRVPSPLTSWAGAGRVPGQAAGLTAALEVASARLNLGRRSYRDSLMIFEKSA